MVHNRVDFRLAETFASKLMESFATKLVERNRLCVEFSLIGDREG